MHHGRSHRHRTRSPPRRSSGSHRSRKRQQSRSISPPRRGHEQEQPKTCSSPRRKRDQKTRDFTHLVQPSSNSSFRRWGKKEDEKKEEPYEVEKPNFGLSGALAKDQMTGNLQNGVVLKFSEPPEARRPSKRYRLYVFKDDKNIDCVAVHLATLHVHRKSAFIVGRDKAVADILTEHPSCSKQHAVLQYRLYQKETQDGVVQEVRPYIMDLNSTNSTFLNGSKIEGSRFIELKEKDVLKFGESTREYVLICAN
ncbi:hypothetical protein PsorP6_004810 [Peronosclerospora sorghi]|uniref:Uncharacterized protein n=1 Tax=Peronosclerospora sorghi TaxID=230839 RepID=A0ACC0VMZ4_9STRA|nr:hypothetical protein PsorP6_004810 [Peronosclerospora sorghi]